MFKKIFAVVAVAAVAALSAPLAANAAYGPGSIAVTGTPAPNATVTVTFNNYFDPTENVNFSVTGEGTATLSILKAATATGSKLTDATGTVALLVKLPSTAKGTYNVTGTGTTSQIVGQAAITVDPSLAYTGGTIEPLVVWTAGGGLLLGIAIIVTLTVVRRQRRHS